MKRIILSVAALVVAACSYAQGKYEAAMQKGVTEVYAARDADAFQASANYFERVSNAEKDKWLPNYYAAYALIMKGLSGAPAAQQDALMNKADEFIAKADALEPNNSEISVLKSMALVVRMQADQSKSMTLGPQATQVVQQAIQQNPDNPRAHMQMAQMLYYTPAAFGGGKEAGLNSLQKSLDAFAKFKPATPLDPAWGEVYAKSLKEQWSK